MRDLIWYLFLGSLSAVVFLSGTLWERRRGRREMDGIIRGCFRKGSGFLIAGKVMANYRNYFYGELYDIEQVRLDDGGYNPPPPTMH